MNPGEELVRIDREVSMNTLYVSHLAVLAAGIVLGIATMACIARNRIEQDVTTVKVQAAPQTPASTPEPPVDDGYIPKPRPTPKIPRLI